MKILKLGLLIIALFLMLSFVKNVMVSSLPKDKESLIKEVKDDREKLIELELFLDEFEDSYIKAKTEKGKYLTVKGYKTYNNSILNYIFEKYRLHGIDLNKEDRDIIRFELSKKKKGVDYWGFYYSKDGKPCGNSGGLESLYSYENGYKENYNYDYYTEKIYDNWYYYEIYYYSSLGL